MTSTQYDRNFISQNIFQASTCRKPARKSSYLNSEEDIDSGREPLENSLSQQLFTEMDRFRQKQKQKEYHGTRNLPNKLRRQ